MPANNRPTISARYTIHVGDDGFNFVETRVYVTRYYKKNNSHTQSFAGNIYTQSRFRAWLKKYGLQRNEDEIKSLPKKSVWGS